MTLLNGSRSSIRLFTCLISLRVLSSLGLLALLCYSSGTTAAAELLANRLKDHPRITIAGVCRDELGRPVGGAEVRMYAVHANREDKELLKISQSDNNGRFVLGEFAQPGLPGVHYGETGRSGVPIAPTGYRIFVLKNGMATQAFSLPCNNPDKLDAVFQPGAELTGQVFGPDAQPIAGVSVTLAGCVKDEIGSSTTDVNGRFVISDIHPYHAEMVFSRDGQLVPASRAGLVVEHPEFGIKQAFYAHCPGFVEIWLEEPAIVKGCVVDIDGRPAARIKVAATSTGDDLREGRWGRAMGVTDDNGNYRLMLQGARTVNVQVHGAVQAAAPLQELAVTPGKTNRAPPIELQQSSCIE